VATHRPYVPSPEAQIKFKQAEELARRRTPDNVRSAIAEYRQALALDPQFAAAWAGLADAYAAAAHFVFLDPREACRQSADAASRALALDPRLAKASSALAYVRSVDLLHWREADDFFRRALRSYANEPLLHIWYAAYLGRIGRHDEAVAHAREAFRLDPASMNAHQQLVVELYRAGRWSEYLEQARELVRMHDVEASAHLALARALEWNRRYEDAAREIELARIYGPPEKAVAYQITLLAARGLREESMRTAARWREVWMREPIETNIVAGVYGALRLPDEVANVLEQGYVRGDPTVLAAATNPYLRPVLQHPRVQAFLKRIGF
jgi:tetratricopeptide (TPR) repeat protein